MSFDNVVDSSELELKAVVVVMASYLCMAAGFLGQLV
jgi:hypothetical protein